jgi:glutamate/tyrosine decarboxylase-like PLP-dependent enzyme
MTQAAETPSTIHKPLPQKGTPWPTLRRQLVEAKGGDYSWEEGRLPLYVYWLDEGLGQVSQEAASMFFMENALGRKAFPSVQQLQDEVIGMALSLFNAPAGAGGSFTSGGTESIFQAVKSARGLKRSKSGDKLLRCRIVVPVTAHPAFDKAAQNLDMDVHRVPIGSDFRVDVAAMGAAIDERTALIVGSAPAYPHGVFDDIAALGELALARGLPLHVDACVGGFLAPFMKLNGEAIPAFDFSLPGVTSLSADIHKYGFAAKGASLILYRDAGFKAFQQFEFDNWPRGHYATETFLGTRPAGPVASAWAVMNYLGEAGYRRIAAVVSATRDRMIAGVDAIEGLRVVRPLSELSFVLYGSNDPAVDINAVADAMTARGWFMGRSVEPPAIHFMVNPVHAEAMDAYLKDQRESVQQVRSARAVGTMDTQTY